MNNTPEVAAKTFETFYYRNSEVIEEFFSLYDSFLKTVKKWEDDAYPIFSLAEEAHEYQTASRWVKEKFRGDIPKDSQEAMIKELGDVFFFWVANSHIVSNKPTETILTNVRKIADRAARNVIKGDGDAR